MSIIVTNEITVPASRIEEVAAKFIANGEKIRHLDGFEGFEVLCPTEPADDRVLVITRWRDEDAYSAWRHSEHFAAGHPQASSHPHAQSERPQPEHPQSQTSQPQALQGNASQKNSVVRHYEVKVAVSPQ